MVRVYEFDRRNGTVWSVDMAMVNGTLYSHARVANPTKVDLQGYWWTCVAHSVTPQTRVLSPSSRVAHTASAGGMTSADWPHSATVVQNVSFDGLEGDWKHDNSFLGNLMDGDFFLRIRKDDPQQTLTGPWIASVSEEGFTVLHGHPLNGTKFFTWGQNGPGRFMQDFLAGGEAAVAEGRSGDYAELQVGPAPTQMQNFAMPAGKVLQWTEWFRALDATADPARRKKLRGDHAAAVEAVGEWYHREAGGRGGGAGAAAREASWVDGVFESLAEVMPATSDIVWRGSPWGALEEARLGKRQAPGLAFELPAEGERGHAEVRPWLALLKQGTFDDESLASTPVSYQTTDAWLALLKASAAKNTTWLHAFHLGVNYAERGNTAKAVAQLNASMSMRPTAHAARCLAALTADFDDAREAYLSAWDLALAEKDSAGNRTRAALASEVAFLLGATATFDVEVAEMWLGTLSGAPKGEVDALLGLDAVLELGIKVHLARGEWDDATAALSSQCFPTYGDARRELQRLWYQAVEGKAAASKGGELTPLEAHRVRRANPNPRNIGCAYASNYCTEYW